MNVRDAFRPENKRRRYLEVEAALAEAQGEMGLIPPDAAIQIAATARSATLDPDHLAVRVEAHGHMMMALVEELAEVVGEHGGWVHWGATTQNIQQTGDILILRDVHATILGLVRDALLAAAELIDRTAALPMAGRTHWQHAVPITFGLKVAAWSDQFVRHHERLLQLEPRLLQSMTGGAAGTFASFGVRGIELQAKVAARLGLSPMAVPSRAVVDHLAEFVLLLGLIAATAQTIAEEMQLLNTPEHGEASEAIPPGQVGSSTMPQKRVAPHLGTTIIAAAHARAAVPLALEAMLQSHEVDGSRSVLMDRSLEQACVGAVEAMDAVVGLLRGLQVSPERMRANLDLTGGLINAEAVMLRLGDVLGRQEAHHVVHHAVERVNNEAISFSDALRRDRRVMAVLSDDEIAMLLDPTRYTGLSEQVARAAADQARAAAGATDDDR
ncbi:MAG: adenylosuccinate lyase family protein [Micropruina sp.]|uniref:class-II fumarase/aspartase family protein n=1 Tax=Micropruina sp. TaxID=2737536 RepID=UPI0039E61817